MHRNGKLPKPKNPTNHCRVISGVYQRFEGRLVRQTAYYGVSLGMTKEEVRYVKGIPDDVLVAGPANKDGWRLIVGKEEMEKRKQRVDDFDFWHYDISEKTRLDIDFDKSSHRVIRVACFTSGGGYCSSVLGIANGTSEEDVIERFGRPAKEEMVDAVKKMFYPSLNVGLYLRRKEVYMIHVTASPESL